MAKRFINPNQHAVYVRNEEGREIHVQPLVHIKRVQNPNFVFFVEGGHFAQFVERGQLALHTEEAPAEAVKEASKPAPVEAVDPEEPVDLEEPVDPDPLPNEDAEDNGGKKRTKKKSRRRRVRDSD